MRVPFLALTLVLAVGCGGSTETPAEDTTDSAVDDSTTMGDGTSDDTTTPSEAGDDTTVAPDDTMSPGDSTPPTDAPADVILPVDGACSSPLSLCGGACVDVTSDTNNCGSCGKKCVTGQVCITAGGATACACPTGKTTCGMGAGAVCTDTTSDNNNCGMCGNRCASGETCTAGACKCDAGASTCPGSTRCFDLTTDPANCGMCGTRCATGATCSASKCSCPTGSSVCTTGFGTACTATTEDPNNCGMCGTRCQDGEMCSGSKCSCRPGLTSCTFGTGTACVDTKTNPRACGMCGKTCMTGENCEGGVCKTAMCSTGKTRCASGGGGTTLGACVDTKTDPLHCGDCGQVCNQDEMCVNGNCRRYRPALGCTTCPCTSCTTGFGGSTCCPKPLAADTMPICIEGTACP